MVYVVYWRYMEKQVHIKMPLDLKRQAQATAALNGVSLQEFIVNCLEYALERFKTEGLPVVDKPVFVIDGTEVEPPGPDEEVD